MDYHSMACEYIEEANNLRNYLIKLKKYYARELEKNNFTPGYMNINFRVKKIYDMYLEIASTGRYLSQLAENCSKNSK